VHDHHHNCYEDENHPHADDEHLDADHHTDQHHDGHDVYQDFNYHASLRVHGRPRGLEIPMVSVQAEVVLRDAAAGLRTDIDHHHDHQARLLEVTAWRRSGLVSVQEAVVLQARGGGLHDHDEHCHLDKHQHPDRHEHHDHDDHGDPNPHQHDHDDNVFI